MSDSLPDTASTSQATADSLLDAIRKELEKFGRVYYGLFPADLSVTWDHIVFRRTELRKKNQVDFARDYTVAIVKENYIPEGYEFQIIDALETNTKLRMSPNGAEYTYLFKGNTNLVVEILTLHFVEPIKRCSLDG